MDTAWPNLRTLDALDAAFASTKRVLDQNLRVSEAMDEPEKFLSVVIDTPKEPEAAMPNATMCGVSGWRSEV